MPSEISTIVPMLGDRLLGERLLDDRPYRPVRGRRA
jgi:hypothetical protein